MIESLAIIVVIIIIIVIAIIAYTEATDSSLRSDLTNASLDLDLFQIENFKYPATIDCGKPESAINHCINARNPFVKFIYHVDNINNPQVYTLDVTNGFTKYSITKNTLDKKS